MAPSRIVGGSEVSPYSLPWQVGLVQPGGYDIFCGGTLISSKHVMSAAHCVASVPSFDVMVGEHYEEDSSDGTRHTVDFYTKHPNYSGATSGHDFVIITLDVPVELGDRAVHACLPTADMDDGFLTGLTLTVSGWGRLSYGGSSPAVLHSVDVPYVTTAVCDVKYSNLAITDTMMCAGNVANGGIDSCQGDSGGKCGLLLVLV